jgi:hypothetical protein
MKTMQQIYLLEYVAIDITILKMGPIKQNSPRSIHQKFLALREYVNKLLSKMILIVKIMKNADFFVCMLIGQ